MNRFTQEQYEIAKNVNLIEFLYSKGYELKKVGKEYCIKEHPSLKVIDNKWYRHSIGTGGYAIQFLQQIENKSLVSAVLELSEGKINIETTKSQRKENKDIKSRADIQLPEPNENNKRVIGYLVKSRGLDYEVVKHFIKEGNIYESKDKHNCVFVGKNEHGNSKYGSIRSTLSTSSFKQDVVNSDKSIGFTMSNPKNSNVFVFESPIDLLSHCTLTKELTKHDFKEQNRVSLGGLSEKALDNFLDKNKNIKSITLCLDKDEAGYNKMEELLNKYKSEGYKVSVSMPKTKDYNTDLLEYKGIARQNSIESNINKNIEYAKLKAIEQKSKENKNKVLVLAER